MLHRAGVKESEGRRGRLSAGGHEIAQPVDVGRLHEMMVEARRTRLPAIVLLPPADQSAVSKLLGFGLLGAIVIYLLIR